MYVFLMFLRTTAEGDYIFLAKDEVCQTKPHLSEKDQSCLGNILPIVAISQVCVCVCSVLQEDLKGWVNSINASLKEIEEIAKWEKATNSSTDPDKSERKERSEGAEPSEGAERSEKSERSDRSDKIEASDKSSEKRDTSEKERGDRAERGERRERGDRGSRGSSTSGRSK